LPRDVNDLAPENLGFEVNEIELTWKGICNNCQ